MLAHFNLQKAVPVTTPMDPHITFSKKQCPSMPQQCNDMKKVPYREIIRSLMWAAIAMRPDITFTISTLSQYLENPGRIQWETAKRVLKYLHKGYKDHLTNIWK